MSILYRLLSLVLFLSTFSLAFAGEADVVKVKTSQDERGNWTFHVTVRHTDTGWKHYANLWEILSEKRELLATRVLAHPHEHEQPFTRSLFDVSLPKETKVVILRAHDSVHKYGGKEVIFRLSR